MQDLLQKAIENSTIKQTGLLLLLNPLKTKILSENMGLKPWWLQLLGSKSFQYLWFRWRNFEDKIFYKERWIKENGFEQRLIVTYSIKYRNYLTSIRQKHVNRAINAIKKNPSKINKSHQNSYKRFIEKTSCTADGKIADKELYNLNTDLIEKEATFDGFYAVCTNLEAEASEIVKINKRRWKIEECFKIMKYEFKARPVHLTRDDRISAHFTTCFIALLIYRLFERKLDEQFTCDTIVNTLRNMDFKKDKSKGYIPTYTRTDFTDALHEVFGFRTDYEIISLKNLKNILKLTKK